MDKIRTHQHTDWLDLIQFYANEEKPSLQAMGDLCQAISESHLVNGLFAHTSHWALHISQTPTTYPPHNSVQWLVIEPHDGLISFYFKDTPIERKQWHRTVDSDDIINRFNGFIRQVGWSYYPIGPRLKPPT